MIADALLSATKALTGLTAAYATIGSVMDFGNPADQRELSGTADPGWVVTVEGQTGGAGLGVRIISSAAEALSAPETMGEIASVTLSGGKAFATIPLAHGDWLRYVAIQAKGSVTPFTDGTLKVQFVANLRNWRAYPAETGR